MTTNAEQAFCFGKWRPYLELFLGATGGQKFHWGRGPPGPLGTAPVKGVKTPNNSMIYAPVCEEIQGIRLQPGVISVEKNETRGGGSSGSRSSPTF